MALAFFAMLSFTASAQVHPQHPHYLEALGGLRDARWLVIHAVISDPAQAKEQRNAVAEIEAAIKEINDASIDDGRNPEYAPHAVDNAAISDKNRLKSAMDYLHAADKNILHKDPNAVSENLQISSHAHIKEAERSIMSIWRMGKVPQ